MTCNCTGAWLGILTCDSSALAWLCKPTIWAVAGNKGAGQQEADQASTDDTANPFQIKKKTKRTGQPLSRPIIAVCNDMYAPALRPLRGVAKIVQFKKPSVSTPGRFCVSVLASKVHQCHLVGHC